MFAPIATYVPRLTARFFPDMLWRVPTEARRAYLTFDDGPTAAMTADLLRILDRHGARATFFLVGRNVARHPDLARDLVAAGHGVGNHTYTHPDAWRVSARFLVDELDRTTRTMEDVLGVPVGLLRPPYGRFTRAMRGWARARRQRIVMWDVMPADYLPGATAAAIEARVAGGLRPGSIVVLHDNPKCRAVTPAALDNLLAALGADGWTFPALGVAPQPGMGGSGV